MDVVEFFSEFRRMCKSSSDCAKCEYHGNKCDNANEIFEKTVAVVEQWSQEHPPKTRQNAFLKRWPETALVDGIISIKPCSLVAAYKLETECRKTFCSDCRRKFWMQEVE